MEELYRELQKELNPLLAAAETGRAGGVNDWSLVGSGGGVGSEGEGVDEGSLVILEPCSWVC